MDLGGCFCGAVRYSLEVGDSVIANCHCSMCRRISAAPFVTWILSPQSAFHYTQGQPVALQSSDKAIRHFCGACGTPLTFWPKSRPDSVDVTACSLDHPERHVPGMEAYEETRLPWLADILVKDHAAG